MAGELKALLIEDNDHWLVLVNRMLSLGGMSIRGQQVNSIRALSSLQAKDFDFVIADLGLPDSKGLETFVKVRDIFSSLPVLVLTGEEDEEVGRKAIALGAADYILKSELKPSYLARSIHFALERQRLKNHLRDNAIQISNLERMIAIERLAGGVAHEINNPLAIIKGLALKMKVGIETGNIDIVEAGPIIERIVRAVDRVAGTVQSLMKISQSNQIVGPQPENVEDLIRTTIAEFQYKFESEGVVLSLDLNCEYEKILCTKLEIVQALSAVIENALQATSTVKRPKLWIGSQRRAGKIYIAIANNGPLIPEELKEKIFEPFFTSRPLGEGKGLGLALARSLVRTNGGEITLDVNQKKATFNLTFLPIKN